MRYSIRLLWETLSIVVHNKTVLATNRTEKKPFGYIFYKSDRHTLYSNTQIHLWKLTISILLVLVMQHLVLCWMTYLTN